MVTNQPKDGHPKKRRKCTTDMEFGTYTLLTKLTPGDNCHGWSPTILRMVTYHSWDGHPPTQEWSPTNLRMVTHQKEVYYKLGI